MKPGEIIRIIVFSLIGALLMFLAQPWIYQSKLIFIGFTQRSDIQGWINNFYFYGAIIVYAASVISTISWYVLATKLQPRGWNKVDGWRVVWWIVFLLPILSIGVALSICSIQKRALISLATFFFFDVLFIYWFTTATCSPKHLAYTPPGALFLRHLIGN